MPYYRIALIGGDGIGPEVVQEGARVLKAVEGDGLHFSFEVAEVGAALYRRTGEDLPPETIELCRQTDAILFGAAGLPDVRHADGHRAGASDHAPDGPRSLRGRAADQALPRRAEPARAAGGREDR